MKIKAPPEPLLIEVDDGQVGKVYRWFIEELRYSAQLAEELPESDQDVQRARDFRIAADLLERHLYYVRMPG